MIIKNCSFLSLYSFVQLLILFSITGNCYTQTNPLSDPSNSANWILNSEISDEFNSSPLDETKWLIQGRNGEYQSNFYGRPPSQFSTNNVRIEDGKLKLETRWEPDYNFSPTTHPVSGEIYENITTAAVISKKLFHYGYMEIKCKAADAEVTSSFWTTGYQSELDMFEMFGDHRQTNKEAAGKDKELKFNMISWNPTSQGQKFSDLYQMPWRVADDFHVYGFDWNPDYIKVYADGLLVDEVLRSDLGEANWITNVPYRIWVDQETFPWHGVPDSKADLELNSPIDKKDDGIVDFEIEYIRIWEKNNLINKDFFGFESTIDIDGIATDWYIDNNAGSASLNITTDKAYRWDKSLKFEHTGALPTNAIAFAPKKSITLGADDFNISLKIWLEPGFAINNLQIVLDDPFNTLNFDVTGLETGKWVTLSQNFTRNTASGDNARLRVRIRPEDISIGTTLMYIDDIVINSNSSLSINNGGRQNDKSKVYPNPIETSQFEHVNIKTIDAQNVTLYNISGTKLRELKKPSKIIKLPIQELSPGLYFISIKSSVGTETHKLIIK